jgi:hypothetical protein
MASQTKIEPVDGASSRAPSSGTGASGRVIDVERPSGEASAPASSTGSLASDQSPLADDEDVSLDELMMSDSNEDDDEPDESTDVNAVSLSTPERADHSMPEPAASVEALGADALDDDEAAALAAAAAAQEAAAHAAAEEADARVLATRRGTEPPARGHTEDSPMDSASSAPAEATDDDAVASESAAWLEAPVASGTPFSMPSEPYSPADDVDPPMSVELEPPSRQLESFDGDRLEAAAFGSTPPALAATAAPKTHDAPLPSFDIPVESGRARSAAGDENTSSRVNPLPTPLSHLSEVAEEDDDDAVTHIGLPVVPDARDDYPELRPGSFEVVDPTVVAPRGLGPDRSMEDARRATTRIVQRIDVAQLRDTNPALSSGRRPAPGGLGAWLSGALARRRSEAPGHDALPPARRRSSWLLDTVLPPLSLVLFGSGIGAGIMLLQPDRGARAAAQQAQTIQALQELPAAKRATTLAERAEAGDGDALFKITNMTPNERSAALTLALERGYQAQKQNEFNEFSRLLEAPGGLATPNLTTRFLSYATSPETMLAAFAHLLTWPGATGPDVLYAVWEKAPGGNRAASLAQQLLHSADQRTKATPALLTALDLRSATTCEDYLRVLPAVQRDGDQRCSATLRALKHTDGCGDDGQKDCFACLRDGTILDNALTAIEKRIPPQL